MDNEKLVAKIQAGDRGEMLTLWEQMRRMVRKEATSWVVYHSNGAELEDLQQAGFIALMRAADSFDPSAGAKFSTMYHRCLLTEFSIATGRRTEKGRCDPLQSAVSLDMPVGEDGDGSEMWELVLDPSAEMGFLDVEERDRTAHLHAALEVALETLPPELQSAIRGRYYRGEAVNAGLHDKAMRLLRNPRVSRPLREFL